MPVIEVEKFSINQFWEKTPTPLKYFLVAGLIVINTYLAFSINGNINNQKEIAKIEIAIESTQTLINRFDEFRTAQYIYNNQIIFNLKNVYSLVEELNDNTNKKLSIILQINSSSNENTDDLLEKLTILNESFEKLQRAYNPDQLQRIDNKTLNSVIKEPKKDKFIESY